MPRRWPIRVPDVSFVIGANAVVIVLIWISHGGLDSLRGLTAQMIAAGQLTALLGTYAALVGLVLMSRSPWLDQLFGTDRLVYWHRWVGFATVWLLVAHTFFTTAGFAGTDGSSVVDEFSNLLTSYPYVLMATVGLVLFIAVAVTSVRYARRRLSYETWYGIHLYAYLAIALAFAHEFVIGSDFVGDTLAQVYWIALYLVVVGLIVAFRIGQPILLNLRHRFRVENVVQEAPGFVSIYISGRRLDTLPVRAGQSFQWRFLAGGGWWRPHPFSLSAAPNGKWLRITAKASGDDSDAFADLKVGTRVFAEGPYGAFTGDRIRSRKVLLVAGGIGITPLRALLEEFPSRRGGVTLLYRASSPADLVFRNELDILAQARGADVHYLVGRRDSKGVQDPLGAASIRRLVPDLRDRDIFVCGPDPMIASVKATLRTLGVPPRRIHAEHFAF